MPTDKMKLWEAKMKKSTKKIGSEQKTQKKWTKVEQETNNE